MWDDGTKSTGFAAETLSSVQVLTLVSLGNNHLTSLHPQNGRKMHCNAYNKLIHSSIPNDYQYCCFNMRQHFIMSKLLVRNKSTVNHYQYINGYLAFLSLPHIHFPFFGNITSFFSWGTHFVTWRVLTSYSLANSKGINQSACHSGLSVFLTERND